MARPYTTARARLGDEAGVSLIEVLATAVLIVVVAMAVLTGFDSASKASGRSKAKSIAAGLAQQDQERLRALKPADLLSMATASRPVLVDGVSYTVTSNSDYLLEDSVTPGCTGGQRDERLGIVSTVSWPNRGSVKPVRLESLIAPPLDAQSANQGSAVIRITRRDGVTGVSGRSVSFVGPLAAGAATGTEGCAFFANFPAGSYRFTHTTSGWTDPSGNEALDVPVSVVANATRSADVLYEPAVSFVGEYWTRRRDAANATNYVADKGEAVSLENAGIPTGGGRRIFSSATAATIPIPRLFPFETPYSVYTGSCDSNEFPRSGSFASLAPEYVTSGVAPPGLVNYPVRVFEPALNVRVLSGATAVSGATVRIRSTVPGCSYSQLQTTTTGGLLPNPGLPYGTYDVCALYNGRKATVTGKANNLLDGNNFDLTISTTSATGQTCPA